METKLLWDLFLKTGSPEIYVEYHQAALRDENG